MMFRCFLLAIIGLTLSVYGDDSWYNRSLEGWYYFEDLHAQEKKEEKTTLSPEEAEEFVELGKIKLKQLLSLAIINPTTENVQTYIREQKALISQSSRFSESWKEALLNDPNLGDFLKNPTTSHGILARREFDALRRQELLKELSKEYFLLFFFQGNDFFSQKLAEAVRLFADANDWKVKAVSLDGQGLQEFPDFELDKGISVLAGVKASPSLFIVNPLTSQIIPIGAGLLSVSEIEKNIDYQFSNINGVPNDP